MPFKSKAQQRKFFAMEAGGQLPKGTARRWAHHTRSIRSLPEKAAAGFAMPGLGDYWHELQSTYNPWSSQWAAESARKNMPTEQRWIRNAGRASAAIGTGAAIGAGAGLAVPAIGSMQVGAAPGMVGAAKALASAPSAAVNAIGSLPGVTPVANAAMRGGMGYFAGSGVDDLTQRATGYDPGSRNILAATAAGLPLVSRLSPTVGKILHYATGGGGLAFLDKHPILSAIGIGAASSPGLSKRIENATGVSGQTLASSMTPIGAATNLANWAMGNPQPSQPATEGEAAPAPPPAAEPAGSGPFSSMNKLLGQTSGNNPNLATIQKTQAAETAPPAPPPLQDKHSLPAPLPAGAPPAAPPPLQYSNVGLPAGIGQLLPELPYHRQSTNYSSPITRDVHPNRPADTTPGAMLPKIPGMTMGKLSPAMPAAPGTTAKPFESSEVKALGIDNLTKVGHELVTLQCFAS